MKIKYLKYLASIFLVFSTSCVTAQIKQAKSKPSLEETITWVIDKFNAYSQTDYLSSAKCNYCFYQDFVYSYDKSIEAIIITYTKQYYKGNSKYQNPPPDQKCTSTIPLNAIMAIKKYGNEAGASFGKIINTYGKKIQINEGNMNSLEDEFPIASKMNKEENIYNRLQKAFADLISHFPKKQETY